MPLTQNGFQSSDQVARSRPIARAWGALSLFYVVFACLLLTQDDVVITSHWGDALHLIDILERMSRGQIPHRDFVTPIGDLAFWPIAMLMNAGLPAGQAFVAGQVLLAGLLAGSGMAIASLRLDPGWAFAFSAGVMVTALALTHGEPEFSLSINVHYNRWSWAIALVALLASLLAPSRPSAWEGVLIGLAFACLALIKITFFVALLPVAILGLVLTGQNRSLAIAAVTGLAVAGMLTALWGADHWWAYWSDLRYVAGADARLDAGSGILALITGPFMVAPTVLCGCAAALLIRSGSRRAATLLVCTYVAGAIVSDQNAGHDPLFFGLLAVLCIAWAKGHTQKIRTLLSVVAFGLVVTIAPNLLNLATSPFRAALADRNDYVPLVIGGDKHHGILLIRGAAQQYGQIDFGLQAYGIEPDNQVFFRNEPLRDCQSLLSPAQFASIADDLDRLGIAQGRPVFVADFLSALWLYGDFAPLKGAAPWSYGGLNGIENAEFVLVPVCPNRPSVHRRILSALEEIAMVERHRTELFRLFEK